MSAVEKTVPVLREATDGDGPRLVALAGELGYVTATADVSRRLGAVRAAGHAVLVAAVEEHVIGWIHLGVTPGLVDAPAARILGLVVAEGWRGRGIGRALVDGARSWAVARRLERLVVTSNVQRDGAHHFYPRLGFELHKTQHVYAITLPAVASAEQTTPGLTRLFHVSEEANLTRFEPRPPPSADAGVTGEMVWAIGDRLLHNYLLPRECPRVTFYAGETTSAVDRERWFGASAASPVVAIEAAWWERVRAARLWLYEFPLAGFTCVDAGADYHVSRQAVEPIAVQEVRDVPAALLARGIELRVVPNLWPLRDAVMASTLVYSFVRMRNASGAAAPAAG